MEANKGEHLRSLYSSAGGVTEVFTAKVDDYVAARPTYPREIFDFFRSVVGIGNGTLVADVGAGTGLFTTGLLEHGYRVVAIEPSAGMREAADARLGHVPGYSSAAGTAEAMPLPDGSIDFITAAQAFHWFDADRARTEFLRVLRPGARVALVSNDRVLEDPLHQALDRFFEEFGGEKRRALVAHEGARNWAAFFGTSRPAVLQWPHEQRLTERGLESLVFSRSYMPESSSERGREAARAVGHIFRRFATHGSVAVRYTAVAYVGGLDATAEPIRA